jgi:hypothetical protein
VVVVVAVKLALLVQEVQEAGGMVLLGMVLRQVEPLILEVAAAGQVQFQGQEVAVWAVQAAPALLSSSTP